MAQSGFNVETFKSSISKNGVMRNNKFLVRMPYPRGMNGKSALTNTSRYLELWCESTNIPGVSLATNEIRRYGYGNIEKKPYVAVNNDVNFSFISDGNSDIWSFFQQWIRMIVNYDMRYGINADRNNGVLAGQKPFELGYKYEYVSDIEVIVFNENGKDILTVILREAYPTFVGDVQLNWGDTNNIARIPVTMTVYDWYNKSTDYDNVNNVSKSPTDNFNHRPNRPRPVESDPNAPLPGVDVPSGMIFGPGGLSG